jgi:hypothetical protein
MENPSEMDVLKQLAFDQGIDPGRLFISDDVVYVMTGEDVTGTVCAVGTPFWCDAVAACIENGRLAGEIQEAIDDPRPSVPHDEVMANIFNK